MKFIYNQFNYPCPFEWNEIPKDVNYLTIEIGDGCKSENEGIDIIGHISYPWCASAGGFFIYTPKVLISPVLTYICLSFCAGVTASAKVFIG